MPRYPLLNAATLNLQFSTNHACCDIGYSMLQHPPFCQFSCLVIFPNVAALVLLSVFLPLACCDIQFPMLQHWNYCLFADFSNAATFNLQCLSIQSIFILFYSFWIFSFFFRFQCSSYHLQHKIPRKSIQNANNANKITKYWDLKYIKFHSYQFPHT